MKLTIDKLKKEAVSFCKHESNIQHEDLIGVTDGKAIGTYIERKFGEYLKKKYPVTIGSSAKGIDLPDFEINTDIKVTSIKKPQSSSPFKNIEQKIYGLGHNLLIFIYEKIDINNTCYLDFKHCMFIEADKSADYTLTKLLRKIIEKNGNEDDIIDILELMNISEDKNVLKSLAQKILKQPPEQGYLTISNAFQWRLKYNNILNLENENINGIYDYHKYDNNSNNFQLPLFFTESIYGYLKNNLKINPDIILEPTWSIGNLSSNALNFFPGKKVYELNIDKNQIHIESDISDLGNISKHDSFLVIGNLISDNEHRIKNKNSYNKNNISHSKKIMRKIIDQFSNRNCTLTFICNRIVSRDIFIELNKNNIEYSFIKQINFKSETIFNLKEKGCILIIQFNRTPKINSICEVSDISAPTETLYKFGFVSGNFYLNIDDITEIDGQCQFEWKHGVKHDCSKIMELNYKNKKFFNNNKEEVFIEYSLIYPLLKSGQLKKPIITKTSKYIIITQKRIHENTYHIKNKAPKTWQYLNNNKKYFDRRKSSIYKNSPDFSIFGIGDESFKKYKIAIAGFNKNPMFSLVYNDKIMMLDDTCHFISFDKYDDAYITMLILNSQLVKKFLKNIAFPDSKRPYSKKVLKRIDIKKCLDYLTLNDLKETEKELDLNKYLTENKFNNYINLIKNLHY